MDELHRPLTMRESIRWLIADRLLRMAFAVMPAPRADDGTGRDLSETIHLYFLRRSIELAHPIFMVSDKYLRDTAVGERQDHDNE